MVEMRREPDNREDEELLRRVRPAVEQYLRRRMVMADADEVCAEVLRVLWARRADIPGDQEIPWIIGVARRVAANHHRGVRRRTALMEKLVHEHRAHSPEPAYEGLTEALAELREEERELLRLWAWEGFEAAEIATIEGCTPNTAAARLSRARKQLRAVLERQRLAAAGHEAVESEERGTNS